GGIIRGAAGGQTVDLFQLQDGAGVILTSFDASGRLVFGPAGAQDTNLYRSGANTLKTDDDFAVGSNITISASGNITQTGATTLSTGTGAISLNGDTTVANGKAFTIGTGSQFTNGSSTVNTTYAVPDDANGGPLNGGVAASASVDIYTSISIAQTTASQTITLPTPTASTTYGRLLYVSNVGTTSFTLLGSTLTAGSSATLVWSNTNGGASWQYAGAVPFNTGNLIQNTTSPQTADFNITGDGVIGDDLAINGDSLTTDDATFYLLNTNATTINAFGAATAINLGADGVVVQGAGSVTLQSGGTNEAIVVQGSGTGSVDIGTNATVHTTTIGSTNGASILNLQAGTGGLNITTLGTGTLAIGNNAVAQTLAIGNTTGATALNLRTGTGNFTLDGVAATTYDIGTSTTTGTIALGGTAQTGTTTIGRSTASNTINIGSSIGGSATQAINIGTSNTASSTTNVTIGSLIGSSKVVLQAGTGGVQIGTNGTPTGQLYVSGKLPTSAVGSVNTGAYPVSLNVQDKYAYVVNESGNNLQIIDVSRPSSPSVVGDVATINTPYAVYAQGRYVYVGGVSNP
ncbi:MAG: hypothetical protein AAB914_04100, partial [Patescibacteria group bacterium]